MTEPVHVPVLLDEVLEQLAPRPGGRYIDGTVNGGGHTRAILAASAPDGRVLGIDRDPDLIDALRTGFAGSLEAARVTLVPSSFVRLTELAAEHGFAPADGMLLDLGLSSHHLDLSGRGFSFARDEPLDMRFDPNDPSSESAAEVLASRDADELAELLRTYGEERFASRIARTLVARRREAPVETTRQLLAVVEQSLPAGARWRAGRDAARVFQALRIAANAELDAVTAVLPQARDVRAPGGRLVVISFHSLEDRLVKHFLKDQQRAGALRVLTKKPIMASEAEMAANPRAGSAKLRAAERL